MVKRITERRTEGGAICNELFLVRASACDKFLVNTVVAHQPPLVVVAGKPDLKNVADLTVLKDLLLGQMAMVVEYGHILCIAEIQLLCGLVHQQKIVFYIAHYSVTPVLKNAISLISSLFALYSPFDVLSNRSKSDRSSMPDASKSIHACFFRARF